MKAILSLFLTFFVLKPVSSQILEPHNSQGRWGVKKGGHWFIEPNYQDFILFKSAFALVEFNGKKQLFTDQGNKIGKTYDAIHQANDSLFYICEGGKYNVIQGEIVGGKWGILSLSGKVLIAPKYHQIDLSECGLLNIQIDGNWGPWGIIDMNENWILEPKFPTFSFDMRPHSSLNILDENHVQIRVQQGVWEILNLKSKKKIKLTSDDFWGYWFQNGLASKKAKNNLDIIDIEGKIIHQNIDRFLMFPNGFYALEKNGDFDLYNTENKKVHAFGKGDEIGYKDTHACYFVKKGNSTHFFKQENYVKIGEISSNQFEFTDLQGIVLIDRGNSTEVFHYQENKLIQSYSNLNLMYWTENGIMVNKIGRNYFLHNSNSGEKVINISFSRIKNHERYYECEFGNKQKIFVSKEGKLLFDYSPDYMIVKLENGGYGIRERFTEELILDWKYKQIAILDSVRYLCTDLDHNREIVFNVQTRKSSSAFDNLIKYENLRRYRYLALPELLIAVNNGNKAILDYDGNVILPFSKDTVYVMEGNTKEDAILIRTGLNDRDSVFTSSGKLITLAKRNKVKNYNGFIATESGYFSKKGDLLMTNGIIQYNGDRYASLKCSDKGKKGYYVFDAQNQTLRKVSNPIAQTFVLGQKTWLLEKSKDGYRLLDDSFKICSEAFKNYTIHSEEISYLFTPGKKALAISQNQQGNVVLTPFTRFSDVGIDWNKMLQLQDFRSNHNNREKIHVYAGCQDQTCKLYDNRLNVISDLIFQDWTSPSNNYSYALLEFEKGWRAVKFDGTFIDSVHYDKVSEDDLFGNFVVSKNNENIVLDQDGQPYIRGFEEADFSLAYDLGFVTIMKFNGKLQLVHENGKTLVENIDTYDYIEYYDGVGIVLSIHGKFGFYSLNSYSFAIPPQYKDLEYFQTDDFIEEFLFEASLENGKKILISSHSQIIFPDENGVDEFLQKKSYGGFVSYMNNGKMGAIYYDYDYNRFVNIKPAFDNFESFELIAIRDSVFVFMIYDGKKKGVQDEHGNIIVPMTDGYIDILDFYNEFNASLFRVVSGKNQALYHISGKIIVNFERVQILDFELADEQFGENQPIARIIDEKGNTWLVFLDGTRKLYEE